MQKRPKELIRSGSYIKDITEVPAQHGACVKTAIGKNQKEGLEGRYSLGPSIPSSFWTSVQKSTNLSSSPWDSTV
eukprot:225254-Ditylum_brightwellii.AAC.1